MFEILFNILNSIHFSLILFSTLVLYLINKLVNNQNLEKRLKVLESDFQNVNHDKRAKGYPPHYPNGWLAILESRNLMKGQIAPIFALGHELVVYRGLSGKVYVMDAYCPHLGANLGFGGTVVGEQIKCPFHGWQFNNEGACTFIPGIEDKNIPGEKIKTWESMEINGFIFAWNHSGGKKSNWLIPDHVGSNIYRGKYELLVKGHVQEIMENIADPEHLSHVHNNLAKAKPFLIDLFPKSILKYFDLGYKLEWKPCEGTDMHMAQAMVTTKLFSIPIVYTSIQYGPVSTMANLEMNFFGKINFLLVIELITLSPLRVKEIVHIYSEPTIKGLLLSKFLIKSISNLVKGDILIWNNKRYNHNPLLTKNETTIKSFRRWYQQFYNDE